jgi:hypothetical protein
MAIRCPQLLSETAGSLFNAAEIRRRHDRLSYCAPLGPVGAVENSPVIYHWDRSAK